MNHQFKIEVRDEKGLPLLDRVVPFLPNLKAGDTFYFDSLYNDFSKNPKGETRYSSRDCEILTVHQSIFFRDVDNPIKVFYKMLVHVKVIDGRED